MHVLIIAHLFFSDVQKELDDLSLTMKNFESRVSFAKDLEAVSAVSACCSMRAFGYKSRCSFYILAQIVWRDVP